MKKNYHKILYLVDYPLDLIGGAQKSTITTCKKMKEEGNDIYILAPNFINSNNTGISDENIFFYNVYENNKVKTIFQKAKLLLKVIRTNKIDIVHAQFPQYAIIMGMLKKVKFIPKNCRTIFTDRDFLDAYNNKYKFIFKVIGNSFNKVICTTTINRNKWKQINEDVTCIPNVLDEKWYRFDKEEKINIKSTYRIRDEKLVIGFAGRLCNYKRWDTVYEICNNVKDREDILVAIAISCEPTNSYKKWMNEYIKSIKEMLGNKLILFVDADENIMEKFYYLIDIFILTSEGESFGRTLIEAMSKKVVTIGTNSGGVPDVINKIENLFEVNDVDNVVRLINNYSDDKTLLDEDKVWFQNMVNERFSMSNFIFKMNKIYEK